MPIVGRVGVGTAGPLDPAKITLEFLHRGLKINGLPRSASMHPAQPPDRGEFIGREIPVVGLGNQRILHSQIVVQRARSGRALETPAPRPVAFVDLANVAGIGALYSF